MSDQQRLCVANISRPKHVGPNIFPQFSLLSRLLRLACKETKIAITDRPCGISTTHIQLVTDVLHARNHLLSRLGTEVRESLVLQEEVYINLLAPAGYEYVVGFLAIIAAGAIVVPIYTALPVSEALYYVEKVKSVAVLYAASCREKGEELSRHMRTKQVDGRHHRGFQSLNMGSLIRQTPLHRESLIISSDHVLDTSRAGLVIYTSGTTGAPKAVVIRRSYLNEVPLELEDLYELRKDDCILHCLPVHHVTGIGANLLPFLFVGASIEFFGSQRFDAGQVWERWRQGGITAFSGVPTQFVRLMRFYDEHIAPLPHSQLAEYVEAVNAIRFMASGSAGLPAVIQEKWTSLRRGRPILTRYGSTEFGAVFAATPDDLELPYGAVGKLVAGVDVKLTGGDEGEILVRSHLLLDRYFDNDEATRSARDADGYFQSGDIGAKKGDYYFVLGRASIDIIKSGGYKIAAPDIEREMYGLPYVFEAMVVGVEDLEYGQRVAAAVVLQDQTPTLDIKRLRDDLRSSLAPYKLPTILRVVPFLPKTSTGKIAKKALRDQIFPPEGHPDVQVWEKGSSTSVRSSL